ncbi:phosphoribosylanthranilate isomerase [Anaeromyxobacter sp. Red801]|uniref:phosphoribosylanthranilate isomerase n=1 Tax=Anaeromyxobacter sp. Red801 TaxID=3411632 RepID=UPI003BA2E6A3
MALPPKVKICGVTRLEDALEAARLGADAIGFNFWPRSKRYLPPAEARALVARLPPFVTAVGVFVDPSREALLAAVAASGVQVAQLHGDEPPELLEGLPFPVLKAIRVGGPEALDQLARYPAAAGFLLDSASPGYGGSGIAFDWALAARAAERTAVVLAGGLTPANVADAVRAVRPWAVDVASGVESAPGVKDRQLMARFVRAAKETT